MTRWSPQRFTVQAPEGYSPGLLASAVATAESVLAVNPLLPPLFSLRHLAHQSGVEYEFLRSVVGRSDKEPYRLFRLRKRPSKDGERRFRVIAIPHPLLMQTQRWIAQRILALLTPHHASVAFSKGNRLIDAAEPHCGARWLIKLDVQNFFESLNEIAAYRVFRSAGYQPLVSFELARICTRYGRTTKLRSRERWLIRRPRPTIFEYKANRMGHLPQGAPTSPMLANLAVRKFDKAVQAIATQRGMTYTRYADDITLSTKNQSFTKALCAKVIGEVYAVMAAEGLSPNVTKSRIASPGARKIVLGLNVDGQSPRLSREFKLLMRQHIFYLKKLPSGPSDHASARGFVSIMGMKNHIYGLASFARQIEPSYGNSCIAQLNTVDWPL